MNVVKRFLLCFSQRLRWLWRTTARRIIQAPEALTSRIGTKVIRAIVSNTTTVGKNMKFNQVHDRGGTRGVDKVVCKVFMKVLDF